MKRASSSPAGRAGETARRLGDTLVAPVMAYLQNGDVEPPTGHMRFAGTITTPPDVFARVVEYAAGASGATGLSIIALMGDSGGSQPAQQAVAEAVNREWAETPARVHHLSDSYPGPGDAGLRESSHQTVDHRRGQRLIRPAARD